jgi:hypothetical protein
MNATGGGGGGFWGFWTTLPGVLSGIAAVITAAGALAGIFIVRGEDDGRESPPPAQPPAIPPSAQPPAILPPAQPATTLADWRRDANSICRQSNQELRATFGRPPQAYEELVAYYQGAVPVVTRALVDLRGLEVPADRTQEIGEFLASLEAQNASAQEAVGAWQAGNAPVFQRAVADVGRENNRAISLAGRLGARECALGPFG